MNTLINGIQISANDELCEEEIKAYIQRGKEKFGRALISVEVRIDGEYADVCYHTKKVPFERIRRITG